MRNLILVFLIALGSELAAQCMQTAPYTQTFATATTPPCWANPVVATIFGVQIQWWFAKPGSPGPLGPTGTAATTIDHTGNGGFFAYAYSGYGSSMSLTSPEVDVSAIASKELSFWMHAQSTSSQNNSLAVDVFDGTWHLNAATFSQNATYWQHKTVSLNGYNRDTLQVRFRRTSTLTTLQDILIDDVFIGATNPCLPPLNPLVTTIGANTAQLSVLATGNHQYAIGLPGFLPDTTQTFSFSGLSTTVLGLQPQSTYRLFVRDSCGPNSFSVWNVAKDFTTTCGVLAAPFIESFNVKATPTCWANYSITSGSTVQYQFTNAISTPIPTGSANFVDEHTGNGGYYAFTKFDLNTDYTLESPKVYIGNVTQPVISFYNFYKSPAPASPSANIRVQVWQGNQWATAAIFSGYDGNWQYRQVAVPAGSTDTLRFRISAIKQIGTNQLPYIEPVLIDDIAVKSAPACNQPDTLWASAFSANAATIAWPQSGTYQVGYGLYNTLFSNLSLSTVSGTSALLNNLQASTLYVVYLRKICGADTSEWSAPLHLLTGCQAVNALPYLETFNALPKGDTTLSAICWQLQRSGFTKWLAGRGPTPSVPLTGPTGDMSPNGAGTYIYTEATGGVGGDTSIAISPSIFVNAQDSAFLSFNYHMFGSGIGSLHVDIYANQQWQNNVHTLVGQQNAASATLFLKATVPLSSFINDTVQLRFRAIRGSNSAGDIALDNISIIDSCVYGAPIAQFTESYDSLNNTGFYVSFTSFAGNANQTTWYFGDGGTDTGQFVVHAYQANGTYTVWQVVQNQCGRVDSISAVIQIGGIGVHEVSRAPRPVVYPNPANQQLTVANLNGAAQLSIYDINGRCVYALQADKNNVQVDVSTLPNGVYFVHITSKHATYIEKLVVLHE